MTSRASSGGARTGCRVLVVDDDREIREVFQEILEYEGFAVTTARNGAEALDRLRSAPSPAVILLDLSMPIMDGATFRVEQRKDASLASIPVVAISAAGSLAEKVGPLALAGHLRKPVHYEALVSTVRRFCVEAAAGGGPPSAEAGA